MTKKKKSKVQKSSSARKAKIMIKKKTKASAKTAPKQKVNKPAVKAGAKKPSIKKATKLAKPLEKSVKAKKNTSKPQKRKSPRRLVIAKKKPYRQLLIFKQEMQDFNEENEVVELEEIELEEETSSGEDGADHGEKDEEEDADEEENADEENRDESADEAVEEPPYRDEKEAPLADEDDGEQWTPKNSQANAGGSPLTKEPIPQGFNFEESLSLEAQVEAILFATAKPIQPGEILEILPEDTYSAKQVSEAIEQLKKYYEERAGGITLAYQRGLGYQMQTVEQASFLMERMFSKKPRPLSRPAQETLAIIAYRQPVTRADIEYIRGVDAGSIIKNLLEKELIRCTGRKEEVGRPMLFGTTEEFLHTYRLLSLDELPPLEAFQPKLGEMRSALSAITEKDEEKGDIVI